ncbi:MAG: hypothetical protein J6H20_00315, partial [Pyramidobacter sp.]|nr:hypothetical protein [Pyramidobacter sp.]
TYNYRTNDKFDLLADVAKELFNDLTPFTFDGSYTNLKSAADVTVETGASLEAGKNLTINSVSAVGVKTGTDLGFMELLEWKAGDKFPSASVVVSKQTGSATATVGGSLKAGGDVTVTAASSLSADLFAEGTVENTSGTAPFQVALVWADLKNDAAATIAPDATVEAGGFLTVQSNVSNSVETKAEIGLSSTNVATRSPGGTALNATFVTTGARTDVGSGAALSASGDVTVNAVNYTDSWTSKAGVKVAAEPFYSQKIKKNLTMPAFKALYKRLGDKLNLPEDLRYGNGASSGDYDGSTWTLAVLYTGQDVFADKTRPSQQGSVTIAPGAKLSSDAGSVVLSSDVLVYDHQWSAVSRAGGNAANSQDHGNAYALAVMYDNADVSSDISIGKGSQLLAGGSIDIQSGARVEWNRLTVTIENLKNTWEQLKKFATIERTRQEWEEAKKLLTDDLYHDTDLSNWEGFKNYSKGIGAFIKTAFTFLTDVAGAGSSAVQLAFSDTLAFIDMESYANVYSKVMARTSNAQDQNFSGGGSFSWSNWRVKNKIDIAREARLSADSGDVTVAGFTRSDVSVIGGWNSNVAGGILASSQGRALGGTVLVSTFDTQNDVQVHKGALLESRDGSLSLTTSDASMQLAANLSAAKAGKWGFQGQLNVLDASIAGRVRVDDEATLKSSAILIQSDAENYATNVAAAIETAQEKALGAAFAIDVLNYENAARVADFDAAFSDDAAPFADAYIAADSLTVNAYSHSHVNTVAVAGSAAWTKEEAQAQGDGQGGGTMKKIGNFPLKVTEKLGNWFGNLLSPSAQAGDGNVLQPDDDDLLDPENANLNDSISDGSSQINNDINNSVSRSDSSSSEPFHFEENYEDNNALDNANQPGAGGQRANLNLSAAGSVAWNFADYTAHAGLEGTSSQPLTIISFTENSAKSAANRAVSISAQADKWQAAFSGGAAAALGAGGAEVTSVGIGGTLSVNSGKSLVSADLTSVKIGALDASKGATKDVIALSAGSSGRSVVGALGLAVTKGSDESGAALAANVSANTLNNRAKSTVSGVSFDTSAAAKAVSTDLDVLSYAKDTQVTGAVDLAVGKSKAAVGAGIQVAVIKNDIGSTIINSTLNNLGAVSIDSFLGVKQVVAGIAVAAGAGNSESAWAYSGALVVDTLINKASAQVLSSDLTASGTVHIAAGDGADIDKRIKQHEASTSFDLTVSADTTAFAKLGSTESFYKGAELETSDYYKKFTEGKPPADSKTTTVDQTLTGRTGLTIITGALTGSGTANGSAAGTAAVVNNLRNTMTTNVQNSTITAAGLNAGSENGAALVAVAAGAAVGKGSWAADGSVVWNSIVNRANTTVQNAAITITGTNSSSLTAQNRALSVGVAGAVGLSVGKVAAGVSLGYSHVTNDAVLSVTGDANKTLSGAGGSLSAAAQNSANSWLAAVAVPVSTQSGAGGGIGALHRITGETSAVLDRLTIDGWSGLGVTAAEKSSAKTLAGAVTVSAQAGAVGGTIAVTQIGTLSGKDQAHTLHAAVNNSIVTMADSAGTLNVATSDDASILTVAVGGGYGGNFQGTGAVGVNLLHRRDLAELNTTNVTGTKTAVSLMGEKSSSLLNVGVEISGGGTGAGGGAIVVNRIGDENLASVPGSKIDVGSFSSLVNSDTRLINAVLGFSGGGTGAGQGMVLVNSVSPETALNIDASDISADQSLAAIAQSDTEMRNYAGQ